MHISPGDTSKIETSHLSKAIHERKCCVKGFEQAAFPTPGFSDEIGEFSLTNVQVDILKNHTAVRLSDVGAGEFYNTLHNQVVRNIKLQF
jgi:hypothetical protein